MNKYNKFPITIIGGLHIKRGDDGKRHLNTDRVYYWHVNNKTNRKDQLKVGAIAKVVANNLVMKVVVVSKQIVRRKKTVKRALELKPVDGISQNTLASFGLTTEFDQYQELKHKAKRNNDEVSFSELSHELGRSTAYISVLRRNKPEIFEGIEIRQVGHVKKISRQQADKLKKMLAK